MSEKTIRAALLTARISRAEGGPVNLYSHAARVNLPQAASTPEMVNRIKNTPGVKQAELEGAGALPVGVLSREQVAQHYRNAVPEIEERTLGELKNAINKRSPYAIPEVLRAVREAGETPGDLELTLANDGDAYRALMARFSQLEGDEDWAAKVAKDVFGGDTKPTGTAKFDNPRYKLPGGKNYREVLLKTPEQMPEGYTIAQQPDGSWGVRFPDGTTLGGWKTQDEAAKSQRRQQGSNTFESSHWPDDANVLAHLRLQDRHINGKKYLHLEELQSDWGQQGRDRGFRHTPEEIEDAKQKMVAANQVMNRLAFPQTKNAEGVATYILPTSEEQVAIDAAKKEYESAADNFKKITKGDIPRGPYVTRTNDWTDLGLKRALLEMAKGGYHGLVWTPGEEQANRYDLSKHLSKIEYERGDSGNYEIEAFDPKGTKVIQEDEIPEEELHHHVGKEVAEKMRQGHGETVHGPYRNWRRLSGLDLKVGGEGMKKYYDEIVPSRLTKIVKEHAPEAPRVTKIGALPALENTPELTKSILANGFKAYASGGSVNHEPTEAQKEAGNYKKEHIKFHGLDISLENKKGSTRSGTDKSGKPWSCVLPADYGYIKKTEGADGDYVDVYVGPDRNSSLVFLINQHDAKTRRFDEHKVMLGFTSERDAADCYKRAFSDGAGGDRLGALHPMSLDTFKHWLKTGDTTKKAHGPTIVAKAAALDPALSLAAKSLKRA